MNSKAVASLVLGLVLSTSAFAQSVNGGGEIGSDFLKSTRKYTLSEIRDICMSALPSLKEKLIQQTELYAEDSANYSLWKILRMAHIDAKARHFKSTANSQLVLNTDGSYTAQTLVETKSSAGNKIRQFQSTVSSKVRLFITSDCSDNVNLLGEQVNSNAKLSCHFGSEKHYMQVKNLENGVLLKSEENIPSSSVEAQVQFNLDKNTKCQNGSIVTDKDDLNNIMQFTSFDLLTWKQ